MSTESAETVPFGYDRFFRMRLDSILFLVGLDLFGNTRAATEHLGMSMDSRRGLLRGMEKTVGFKLFDCGGSNSRNTVWTPTAAGKAWLTGAREIAADTHRIEAIALGLGGDKDYVVRRKRPEFYTVCVAFGYINQVRRKVVNRYRSYQIVNRWLNIKLWEATNPTRLYPAVAPYCNQLCSHLLALHNLTLALGLKYRA